jgi:hypothetical protein
MTFDDFTPIEAPVPPALAEAFGYRGKARFVAVYWSPLGDELYYDDGRLAGTGNAHPFLTYRRHPVVKPHLETYHLGSSEEEGTHVLVLDREKVAVRVGQRAEALSFVRGQHPPVPELSPEQMMAISDHLEALLPGGWREVRVNPLDVLRVMQEERNAIARIQAFLDQHEGER